MSSTLYRKYRPQKFSEIIGQNHIVQTLSNALKHNRVGQAYLFTGPRGTGKTTAARIFAKAVNCANLSSEEQAADKLSIRRSPAEADNQDSKYYEPCLICDNCKTIQSGRSLDIIEIDAASNTGVDNIRELRETVNLPPTSSKYKVYIIDEAHMLSTGAFNALLKTLEEPPAHAIFILATTAIHKIPETIISRCQRFDFSRLSLENIIKKISAIAQSEKVKIEKEALEMIAIAAEGGMRDAESLLTQIIALEDKEITTQEVEEILGTTDRQAVEEVGNLLFQKNTLLAINRISQLSKEGYDLEIFSKSFLNYLRQLMLVSIDPKLAENFSLELTQERINSLVEAAKKTNTQEILQAIEFFSEAKEKIKSTFIPQLPLEMAIIKSIGTQLIAAGSQINDKPPLTDKNESGSMNHELRTTTINPDYAKNDIMMEKNLPSKNDSTVKKSIPLERKIKNDHEAIKQSSSISLDDIKAKWNKFLEEIKPYNHSLNAVLRASVPVEIKGNVLVIATKYGFHRERINEPQSKLTISEIFDKIFGTKIKIRCVSEEEAGIKIETNSPQQTTNNNTENKQDTLLSDALNIFGGKIVK